jgi:hypothetical protein
MQVGIDLDTAMNTFVPVKQVRKNNDEGVRPRQWLLHRRSTQDRWSIICEDNNIKWLNCDRFDLEKADYRPRLTYADNAQNGVYSVRMNADEDYVLCSRTPINCDPDATYEEVKEVIITKTTANTWMSNFSGNRYKGNQVPIRGTAHAQRQGTSRMKAIECNFASRGTYFLEEHRLRGSNPDFTADGSFTDKRYEYEFDVDPGESTRRRSVMLVGDKEAIFRYDRMPKVSGVRQGFRGGIVDGAMSSFIENLYIDQWRLDIYKRLHSEYTRSVYSANGVLHIIDPELGVIKVDQYGNVM